MSEPLVFDGFMRKTDGFMRKTEGLLVLQGEDPQRGSPGMRLCGSDKISAAWVKVQHIPAEISQHVGEAVPPK